MSASAAKTASAVYIPPIAEGRDPVHILGIDPGSKTGWCLYNATERRVIAAGEFEEDEGVFDGWPNVSIDAVVIERPKGQGPTRPQVVECGIVFGSLRRWAKAKWLDRVHELLRYEVKSILSAATHGEINVRNDASAWAALVLLHGEGSGDKARTKKGQIIKPAGCIGGVRSHERAALAVAVAFAIREGTK